MNNPTEKTVLRRILVVLDNSREGAARMESATRLAARCGAELLGLFVEDINLLNLAGLPFAREIAHNTATGRVLDRDAMERSLRAQADELRHRLESGAAGARITCNFRVTRGHVVPELLALARDIDLMVLGDLVQAYRSSREIEPAALQVLMQASCSVWLQRRIQRVVQPVIVLVEDKESVDRLLTIGSQLAIDDGDDLLILIASRQDADAAQIEARTHQWLSSRRNSARISRLASTAVGRIAQFVDTARASVLVLSAKSPQLDENQRMQLLGSVDCTVVVVR
jgi:nucleotide-binding universal stress UspA family protein